MKRVFLAGLLAFAFALAAEYQVKGKVVYLARGPMGAFQGTNEAVTGALRWDPGKQTLEGEVCVDLSTWDSGEPLRDKHTRSMFEVEKYPKACLVLTGIEGDPAKGAVKLLGELTLHGVTQAVAIPGTARIEGGRILFEGTFETKITDWKMKRPRLMGFKVRDQVEVQVYGEAVPK